MDHTPQYVNVNVNVNVKFLNTIQKHQTKNSLQKVLGICSLFVHVVHPACIRIHMCLIRARAFKLIYIWGYCICVNVLWGGKRCESNGLPHGMWTSTIISSHIVTSKNVRILTDRKCEPFTCSHLFAHLANNAKPYHVCGQSQYHTVLSS